MPDFDKQMHAFYMDIAELSRATSGIGWDKDVEEVVANPNDLGAKSIPRNEWTKALVIAAELTRSFPWLDLPTPGADPEGFVWLTWTQGETRGLALEIRKGQYKWTQRDENGKKTIVSDSLNDVAEAMRTVFRRPS